MKILIVLNQADTSLPIEHHDFVIGVDGGCRWCLKNDHPIDLAVGDFDSLSKTDIQALTSMAIEIERHPVDKDFTDLELALATAMNKSPATITVLGVWGGRVDHSLANLLCIAMQSGQVPVKMPGPDESGYLIKNQQKITITAEINHCISILALGNDCSGVSNSGLKYPLNNAHIKQGTGIGLSNLTTEILSEISLQEGILLILTGRHCEASISQNIKGAIT